MQVHMRLPSICPSDHLQAHDNPGCAHMQEPIRYRGSLHAWMPTCCERDQRRRRIFFAEFIRESRMSHSLGVMSWRSEDDSYPPNNCSVVSIVLWMFGVLQLEKEYYSDRQLVRLLIEATSTRSVESLQRLSEMRWAELKKMNVEGITGLIWVLYM